jgi:CheY-like chemotaxis protein
MTRALIVDDSKLARMTVIKALSGLDDSWEWSETTNADEALELAKAERFDVALLDFNMPGRDGLMLASDLRALFPQIGLVLISANAQQEVISRCEAVGVVFLAKPFKPEALAAALRPLG